MCFCSEVEVLVASEKITFEQAARFNYELDRNEKLKTALKNLSQPKRDREEKVPLRAAAAVPRRRA